MADPRVLANDPTIVCRECGKTWPAGPKRTRRRGGPANVPLPASGLALDAERRPLITFSDTAEKAWAAKMEGDISPRSRRPPRLPMTVAAVAALAFVFAFVGGREAAVTALPDLAGLYAALGIPVNLDGIAIEDVAAERAPAAGGSVLVVSGSLRNVSGTRQAVPSLVAVLYDSARESAGLRSFDPPARMVAIDERTPFRLRLDDVPPRAVQIVVRFRRPGERLPAGVKASAAVR